MTIQFPRGSKINNDAHTGPKGSLTFDEDRVSLRLHDGVTPGGFEMPVSHASVSTPQGIKSHQINPVWFFAWRTNTITTSTGNNTFVFNSSRTGSVGYNTSTGVFTAPAAGVYVFLAQVLRESGLNSNGVNLTISRNNNTSGADAVRAFQEKTGTSTNDGLLLANAQAVMPLNKGDTVRLKQEGDIRVRGSNTDLYTWFQGYML